MRAHFYGRSQNYLGILALWMTSEPPPPISSSLVTVTMTPSRPLRWPTQKHCQCPLLMCGHRHGRPSKWTATIKRRTEVLHALASLATVLEFFPKLWWEITHISDE